MKIAGVFLIFSFFAAINSGAQERSARIYHAEGTDFSISFRDERTVFPAGAIWREGINLEHYGIVHTGAGAMLELQLIPSGTLIKLSENTSLNFNGYDENGKFTELGLLYGSIRVVTGNGTEPGEVHSVVIRGGGVSVRLDDGDLGVDYVIEPDYRNSVPRPVFRVYPFRGSAEVFPYGRDGTQAYFGGAQTLSAEAWESLSLDVAPPYTYAEKKPLDAGIADYWRRHNFSGSPPLPMPDTRIARAMEEIPLVIYPELELELVLPRVSEAPVEPVIIVPPEVVRSRKIRKNVLITVGVTLMASSVPAHAAPSLMGITDETQIQRFRYGAWGAMGLGAVVATIGVMTNIYAPVK